MTTADSRPLRRLALVLALLAAACGKRKEAARLTPAPVKAEAPLTDTISDGPAKPAFAEPAEVVPAWAKEAPHFFMRDGVRFASAVGSVRFANVVLARAAAEDRARADLIRLIGGGTPDGAVEGALPGASPTDFFTKKNGQVFVRVEVRTTPG